MISSNPHVLVVPARRHEAGAVVVEHKAARASVLPSEARIDDALEQSFPASDPPSWNMGVADPDVWRA